MLKLSAGPTAPKRWGLRGNEPWTRMMTYVKRIETAEKMIMALA